APAKLVEDLEPVQIGQIQVEQDEIELGFIEKPNPFGRSSCDEDVVTASLKIALDVLGKYLFVLDQEDPTRHPSSSGRRGQVATGCGGRRRSTNIYNRQSRYGLIHINRTESSLAGRSTLSAGLRCAPSTPVRRILEAGVTERPAAWPGAG